MSDYVSKLMEEMTKKYGPAPSRWTFGDGIDWTSPLVETTLSVELPFWLVMMPDTEVSITWAATEFEVTVRQERMELFHDFLSDSRQTAAALHLDKHLFMTSGAPRDILRDARAFDDA